MLPDSKTTHRHVWRRDREADFIDAMNNCGRAKDAPPQGPAGMDIRTPHFSRKTSSRTLPASSPPPSPTGEGRLALPTSFVDAVEVCLAIPQRNCGRISRPSPVPERWKEHEPHEPIAGPERGNGIVPWTHHGAHISGLSCFPKAVNVFKSRPFSSYHRIQI